MKRLRVTVEGKIYEVLVEMIDDAGAGETAPASSPPSAAAAPGTAAVAAPVNLPPPPKAAAADGEILSPLAGKVVSIDVKRGQKVEDGVQVATIEAMKMNTYVFASRSGVIAEIAVSAGDGVEEGAVLLRLA
jgi:biotin carboxyl carrier protein